MVEIPWSFLVDAFLAETKRIRQLLSEGEHRLRSLELYDGKLRIELEIHRHPFPFWELSGHHAVTPVTRYPPTTPPDRDWHRIAAVAFKIFIRSQYPLLTRMEDALYYITIH